MFDWTCSYCHRDQTVVDERFEAKSLPLKITDQKNDNPRPGITYVAVCCANQRCKKLSIKIIVGDVTFSEGHWDVSAYSTDIFDEWILPKYSSKPQPEFIPNALREDYYEACAIVNRSPKAAATLARRCLQGMIRDFCGFSKATLDQEIRELNKRLESGSAPPGVTTETVEAIDHVRSIGNIGAHMEKDINQIIPVDEGEARVLLDLVELLFEDWYIARNSRIEKLAKVKAIAEEKKSLKQTADSSTPEPS